MLRSIEKLIEAQKLVGKTIAAIKSAEDKYGVYLHIEFTDGTDAQVYSALDGADMPIIYS